MNVPVFYETWKKHTAEVAGRIADRLKARGHDASAVRCSDGDAQALLEKADAVVLGAPVRVGSHHKKAIRFAQGNRGRLDALPTAFFTVCLSAQGQTDQARAEVAGYEKAIVEKTGWTPGRCTAFAGAMPYRQFNFLLRFMMKRIVGSQGGPADTSRDHVLTDWEAVDAFADEFADSLEERDTAPDSAGLET